jgi:phenylalanyl-tRNA synthetase beta subunit
MKKCNFHFRTDYHLVPGKNEFFFAGQQFEVILKGEKVGELGVINPKVLRNFGWLNPTAMWELDIEILEKHFTAAFK